LGERDCFIARKRAILADAGGGDPGEIPGAGGGEKPRLLAVGHYHKQESFFYRNVHAIQTACLCAQTPWMRGKGISAALGGWLIELHVDDEGTITRIKPEFMPFYKAIREDYRNWA